VVEDSNVARTIGLVLATVGFGAGLWLGPAAMRPAYSLLLGAVLTGNLPELVAEYINVPSSVLNTLSGISLMLAAAGMTLAIVQFRRARRT
jgi:hypothetical protein